MSVNEVKNPHAKTIFQVIDSGQTFCLGDEDHTLANALRHVLIEDGSSNNVEFAGYSVPHPSEPMVQIRVQTSQQQSKYASGKALQSACVTLLDQCQHVLDSWEELLPETKEDRLKNEARLLEEARQEEEEEDEDEEEAMEEDE